MTNNQAADPVISTINQYPGPNAHLLSLEQTTNRANQGLWKPFHNSFIIHTMEELNQRLPPEYRAINDKSLMIAAQENPDNLLRRSTTVYPVVSVYDASQSRFDVTRVRPNTLKVDPTFALAVADPADVNDAELEQQAVIIRENLPRGKLGRIVGRIEIFSPSNKDRTKHEIATYIENRDQALKQGTILYELDLLHETPHIFNLIAVGQNDELAAQTLETRVPIYPDEPEAHPYLFAVTDPLLNRDPFKTNLVGFDVDDPFPRFNVVASNAVILTDFSMDDAYNSAFTGLRHGVDIDYNLLPDPDRRSSALEKYSAPDQERIKNRRYTVILYNKQGADLESGPFVIDLEAINRFFG